MKKNKIYQLQTSPLIISLFLLTLLTIISCGRMGQDEGMWSYIGRVWSNNGIPPYVGAVENKTPGIFELNAISYSLFGVNIFFLRGLGVISILLSSLIVYCIGRKLHSHLSGIFGMYIFGLSMTWILLDGAFVAQTETFMILFSTLSFYFVIQGKDSRKWKYWFLLAGLSMGFAIAFKQIALTTTVALLSFLFVYPTSNLTKQNKFLGLILLGIGICISTFLSIIPLLLSGVSIKEYIDGAWLILLNKGSSNNFQGHILAFFSVWGSSRIVIFYPCLFLFFLQKDLIRNKYFIGLLIWLLFDFVGVNSSGYYFGHQIKQLIPSLSLIIGILLGNLLINFNSTKAVYTKHVSIVITTIIIIMFPYQSLIKSGYLILTSHSNPYKEIGIWLRDNTNKKEYVYVFGDSPILSYSERVSPSKHFSQIFITTGIERDILFSDLKEKPPAYILKRNAPSYFGERKYEDARIDSLMNNYTFLQSKGVWDIYKRN
jgi:4-amino-4-deoxy-L-arabinose transferase-like glycosyltransferase